VHAVCAGNSQPKMTLVDWCLDCVTSSSACAGKNVPSQSQLLCILQQETQLHSKEEGEEGSERLDKADGRWDFAKILAQDA